MSTVKSLAAAAAEDDGDNGTRLQPSSDGVLHNGTNGVAADRQPTIPRLEDFEISEKTGFLMEEPLTELPAYFEEWNQLGRQLPNLLTNHQLREAVDKMSLLDHQLLSGPRQWRLAYTILSFVGNGYVWQEGQAPEALVKKIPRQLAIPWFAVSSHLGLKPSVCQVNGVLSNWTLIDSTKPLTIENMRLICEFPGGKDCQWFFLVSALIEIETVGGLKHILAAKQSVLDHDNEKLSQSLDGVTDNIKLLKSILARMHENLDSDVFYHVIRPYLSGWGATSTIIPKGLIFEGVSSEPIHVIGSSAAQSSTIQCFDAALGITHEPERQRFLDEMRNYMLPAHARFIAALREAPSIRDYVSRCNELKVVEAYKRSIQALVDFRSYHIQITTKYVVAKSKSNVGTGGTALTPFLKSIRSTTSSAAQFNS